MKTLKELADFHKCDKAAESHHTYDIPYEFHFGSLRDKEIKLLELGVGGYTNENEGGASLRMFKEYFTHPNSRFYGIDIVNKKSIEEERIKTFKGSATDEIFLNSVIDEIGEPNLIIDDSSHVNSDVITSFKILFPKLKTGGIYVAEDLLTSYFFHYGGNPSNDFNSVGFFKGLIHGLNYKEIMTEQRGKNMVVREPNYYDLNITSIHFYHSMCFIYKGDNSVTA